jgi:tetrapyrrole methylase family protein/MazG family protein
MTSRPTPAEAFGRLAELIDRLRAPGGCPWDREQTHSTLRTHLIEETYETLEAIELGDDIGLREELGDLLMQPVMHAQIAAEESRFDIVDVLEGISDKLVRRHPHVFGEVIVDGTGEVLRNWDAIKKQEKAERAASKAGTEAGAGAGTEDSEDVAIPSILDDVPRTLPSLSLALKVSKKAAKVGFEWPDVQGVLEKLREETAELEADIDDKERVAEELGDVLFTAVNIARWKKIDPELALRDGVARFEQRFRSMEAVAAKQGLELNNLSPDEWEALWATAKAEQQAS